MPEKTFRFLHTWEIEAFRKVHPLGEMQIVRNPKTGKHFFVFEGVRGTITRGYPTEPLDHPVISEILNRETGETFFLLHNRPENRFKEPLQIL